jgi:hypothetical protein
MSAALSSGSRPPLRMYHWRLVTISSGRSPFSKYFTAWVIGRGSPCSSSDSPSSSTMISFAEKMVLPAIRS